MSRLARRPVGERGAVTVVAVACCALLTLVTAACVGAAGLVVSHRRAEAAADLAALAAAQALADGKDGCAAARRTATDNHGRLTGCRLSGPEAVVEVTVSGAELLGHRFALAGRARAGPATTP